jgi:hypothetical protein
VTEANQRFPFALLGCGSQLSSNFCDCDKMHGVFRIMFIEATYINFKSFAIKFKGKYSDLKETVLRLSSFKYFKGKDTLELKHMEYVGYFATRLK